jgi:type I restriction enzyme S subunit
MRGAAAAVEELAGDEVAAELPRGWQLTEICAAAQINPSKANVQLGDEELVSFVPMAAVEALTNKLDASTLRPFGDVKKNFTRFIENDVLFAKITPCMENGKIAVARGLHNGRGCGTTEFHVLRCGETLLPQYLYYFVSRKAFRNAAKRNMSGAVGQQRVPADFVRDAIIPVAPLEEQRRIVSKIDELFSDIEAGERALARARAALGRYRKSVLKAAVTGALTKDWREANKDKLEPAEKLLARILDARRAAWEKTEFARLSARGPAPKGWKTKYIEPTPLRADLPFELPATWVWASIDVLCPDDTANGISVAGNLMPPGVPALRLDAITASGFDYSKRRYIDISEEKAATMAVREGHLYVSRANGTKSLMGRAVAAGKPPELIVFPDTIIRFGIIEDLANWLNLIWPSHLIRDFLEQRAKTSAGIWKIAQSDIKPMPVPIPSEAERREIASRVAEAFSKANHVEVALDHQQRASKALRQSILKSAFEGRLVPQDPTDEPAAKLIERTKAKKGI